MEMSSGFRDVTLKLNRTKSSMSFKNESVIGVKEQNYMNVSNASMLGTPQGHMNPSMIKSISTPNSFLGLGEGNIGNFNRMSVLKENINKNNGSH